MQSLVRKAPGSTLTGNVTWDVVVGIVLTAVAAKNFAAGAWYPGLIASLSIGMIFPLQLWSLLLDLGTQLKKRGYNPTLILGFGGGLALSSAVIFAGINPAQAQFLNNAETFIKTALSAGVTGGSAESLKTMVGLAFTLLRLAFIVYMAVAIVQIVQKGNNGEDIQTIARTPVIVAACVFIGDALAGMIVGTGTTTQA